MASDVACCNRIELMSRIFYNMVKNYGLINMHALLQLQHFVDEIRRITTCSTTRFREKLARLYSQYNTGR